MNVPSSGRNTIAYHPFFAERVEKGYTFRMREVLAGYGEVVAFDGIVATWRRHRGRIDCFVVNWTDNDLVDRRTRTVAWRKVLKVFAKTIAWRLAARRLVFVRHNAYPHGVAAGHEEVARRWVDRYERLFDVVLTHSGDPAQRSRLYCPHPLYHRVEARLDSKLLRSLPPRFFVVFGRIVRYKQIERLMAAFPDDETLLVIGAVGDATYARELAAIDRPNVLLHPGLVDEADAQAIVARATALLVSHADPDVVVSASFFFAMSMGVPVIAVATPFLRWIAPQVGAAVTVVDDVDELLTVASTFVSPPVDAAAIDQAFGDATIHDALGRALNRDIL